MFNFLNNNKFVIKRLVCNKVISRSLSYYDGAKESLSETKLFLSNYKGAWVNIFSLK